jgi:hypothetical protein
MYLWDWGSNGPIVHSPNYTLVCMGTPYGPVHVCSVLNRIVTIILEHIVATIALDDIVAFMPLLHLFSWLPC